MNHRDVERLNSANLEGYVLVFTHPNVPHIEVYEEFLKERGAAIDQEITEETDYLIITKEPNEELQQEAAEYSVPTLMPSEFNEILLSELDSL